MIRVSPITELLHTTEEGVARLSPFEQVLSERHQGPETRKPFLRKLERLLGTPVVTYYTSFNMPVAMSPEDIQMMESVLQGMDLSKGLAVVLSSPGGNPLSAEGIIRVCRSYSGTGNFAAVIPGQAKSAATMVCMGAERLIMGPASELGPVDPQVAIVESGQVRWFSAHNVVRSYEKLFADAVKSDGNLEPYLQQLQHYDSQEVEEHRSAIKLSEDIAVRALRSGMMKGKTVKEVRECIKIFLEPATRAVVHGRAIHREEAESCGLKIESCEAASDLWKAVYALHIRCQNFVSIHAAKSIENKDNAYFLNIPSK